jgi:hypothetical protein
MDKGEQEEEEEEENNFCLKYFIILKRIKQNAIIDVHMSSCKVSVILVRL